MRVEGSERPASTGAAPAGPATAPDARWERRLRRGARVGGALLVALGVAVLCGWAFDVAVLKSVQPGRPSMKANTALSFVLIGVALLGVGPRLRTSVASGALGLSGLTLVQYTTGLDFGIDQAVFGDRTGGRHPGRMSMAGAGQFLLLSLALLLLDARWRIAPWLAIAAGSSATVALLAYLHDVPALSLTPAYASMALHTTVGSVIGAMAVLAARPDLPPTDVLVRAGPGGMMARRLLPVAFLVPCALSIASAFAAEAGLFSAPLGAALAVFGSIACFIAVIGGTSRAVHDAHQRQLAATARLHASEQNLAITLQSIGDGVIATDAAGRVTRMNAVAEQLTGWPLADAVGRPLRDVFHIRDEDTRAVVESPVDAVLRHGTVVGLANHTLLIARDGSERAIADSGAPIRGAGGATIGVVLVFRDQSEERVASRELAHSEARKRAVLDAALDGIVTADQSGLVLEWNDAAAQLFGRTRDEVIGRSLVDLIVPEPLRERHRNGWLRYVQTGVATILGRRIEIDGLHASGRTFPIELAVVATRIGRDHVFTAYIRDLTERDRARTAVQASEAAAERQARERERAERTLEQVADQLRQAQKMEAIGRLAGGIAHDFNNLLSVILGHGEMLAARLPATSQEHADVNAMVAAGERAAALTRQLLAFSRRQVLHPVVIDLAEVFAGMQGMLRRLIGEDIELRCDAAPDSGRVRVDRSQIEQVILNLAVNARDAMPNGGRLAVRIANVDFDAEPGDEPAGALAGPHVMLAISDTGTGMDKATLEHLFEPFFTTKPKDKGTGLGLATVQGIVEQSGGHVYVYSELGLGTTFKLFFPRTDAPVTVAAPEPAGATEGTETVLLVEDEESVRNVVATALTRHGYSVIVAGGPGDALRLVELGVCEPALLLTDVVMPGMSGPELARRLRELRPTLRVLCMSGYSDDAGARQGQIEAGIAFLEKPLTPSRLLRAVRAVLDA